MLSNKSILSRLLGSKKRRFYEQSRVDFYTSRNKLASLAAFENLLFPSNINAQHTQTLINLDRFDFGQSPKQLIKTKGKPNFSIKRDSVVEGHEVLFYKKIFNGLKCIQQYHFFDQQFFYGHVEFRSVPKDFDVQLEELLQKKYHISLDQGNIITDDLNNIITVHTGLIKQMTYLSSSFKIVNPLRLALRRQSTQQSALQPKHLEKLIHMI